MGKILVVDGQFGVRSLLFKTFQEDQHEVETAANGSEAIKLFIALEPDLILLDMKMPGMCVPIVLSISTLFLRFT